MSRAEGPNWERGNSKIGLNLSNTVMEINLALGCFRFCLGFSCKRVLLKHCTESKDLEVNIFIYKSFRK